MTMQDTGRRVTGAGGPLDRARHAPMIDTALALVARPMQPLAKRFSLPRVKQRHFDAKDIRVPRGFTVELVAADFNAPVHCSFDDEGYCYVSECGHKIEAIPRVVKLDPRTGEKELFFELPRERWKKTGAFTGGMWHDGWFYFMNTDTFSRVNAAGVIEDLVTDLAGLGDHQSNYPVLGADGKFYFGQGTATNTAVVGTDNYAYEWPRWFPDFHDRPARDVVLNGHNYEFPDVLGGNPAKTVKTGAYVPFGTETTPGQVIPGTVKCSGAVLRCNPDGSDLEVVAWGLRNPYGIAFAADGRLFATEHGIDERNARHIIGDHEDFYEIVEGEWYGWPDFASGIRLDDPYWGEGGRGREPLLAEHPNPNPPKPFAQFMQHSGPNGLDFCRDADFGFEGQAFVALFGDLSPVTSRLAQPAGFKVVRVDLDTREVVDFAVNKAQGPASKLFHSGFERPSHCAFGPDGALYVVDWGEIQLAPEVGGIREEKATGAVWRIRRTDEPVSQDPPAQLVAPFYAGRVFVQAVGGLLALGYAASRVLRR